MIKVETGYVINTADELKQLFSHYAKLGYKSWSGRNLEVIVDDFKYEFPCVFYFNPQNKTFETSDIDYVQHDWNGPVVYGLPCPIKTEFEREFKRIFRVNRVPNPLTLQQEETSRKNNWLL